MGRSQGVRQRVLVPRSGVRILPPQPGESPPARPDPQDRMSIGAVVLAAGQGTRMHSDLPEGGPPPRRAADGRVGARRPRGGGRRRTRSSSWATRRRPSAACSPRASPRSCRPSSSAPATPPGWGWPRSTPPATRWWWRAATRRCCPRELVAGPGGRSTRRGAARGHDVTAVLDDAGAYGRVVRAGDGTVARVVEARDASAEELAIGEFNAGLYAFDRARARRGARPASATDNAQGELLPHRRPRAARRPGGRPGRPATRRWSRGSTTAWSSRPARPSCSGACATS